ncbi:MAG: periplasmic heavy metal sensor [Tardiphaga sp.]|nr:periplasmic heavy metal sensor [Tardiphaga sp.]
MKFWPSPPNRLRWALLASLCLNLALATYVSAQWFQPAWSSANAGMPLRMVERIASRLPKEDADILWRIYRDKQPDVLPLQAEYIRALRETMQLTGQTDLDRPALRAAIRAARDKRIKIGDAVIDTFIDMLEQISPKGRRQLVGGFLR